MGSITSRLDWDTDGQIATFDVDMRLTFYRLTCADSAEAFIMQSSMWRGHLRSLSIENTSWHWAKIKVHLSNCHMLDDLHLAGCNLAIAQELAEIVQDLTCLSTISIRFNLITPAETKDLLSRFRHSVANIWYVWNANLDCMCSGISFVMVPQNTKLQCLECE